VAGGGGVLESPLADTDIAPHAQVRLTRTSTSLSADALDDLAIVARGHAELAGLRVAHVDVHDGGSGARRVDGGGGDLLGVIGQCGLLVTLVSSPVMAQVIMTSEFMVVLAAQRAPRGIIMATII